MPIRDEAINVFMGLPGDGDRLDLQPRRRLVRDGHRLQPHRADRRRPRRHARREHPLEEGIEPEKPPYRVREGGSRICFVRDPDGYRIELIERSRASG